MAVLISGKLIGPNGDPRPGVTIMLTAVKTSSAVVHLAPSSSTTGPDGSYSLPVEVGTHNVMIEAYGRPFEKVGQITVYSDSKPGTLNDFLTSPGQDELTPAIVAMVDDMRAAAAEYAAIASDAATRAKGSEENAQNIADANTYYTTPEDPDGTITGLAGTPNGKSFRVGLGPGKGFKTYINNNGVALEISESPSAEQVTELYGKIKTVDLELTEESSYPVAGKNGEAHIYVENKKIGGSGLSDSLHKDIQQKLGGSILSSQDGELIDENVWPALVRNGKVYGHFDGRRLSVYDIIIENPDAFDLSQAKSFAPLITNGRTLYRWRANRAMLDRLVNTRGKILGIGDSYMDFATILQILANWLYGVHGKSADGWASVCGPVNGRKMYLNEMSFTFSGFTAWSIGGPDNETAPYGCGIDGYCIYTSGTDATAKLSNFDGTRITIYHRDSGSFRYRIDGGSWVIVTTSETGGKSKTEITGLTAGLHSIDIDTTVNTDVVAIYSFYAKNWDKAGIEVHKCGHAGARGIQYLNKISPHIPYFAKEINPDLVIIILGTNDYRYPTSNVSNFIAGIHSIVSAFRSVSPDVGIVFIAPPDTKGIPANPAVPLISFVNAAREYSAANNIEFVDWHGLTPDWETANRLGQVADDLHVNDNGATGLVNSVKDTLI